VERSLEVSFVWLLRVENIVRRVQMAGELPNGKIRYVYGRATVDSVGVADHGRTQRGYLVL
jgi:hypothetical protein